MSKLKNKRKLNFWKKKLKKDENKDSRGLIGLL